MAKQTQEIDFVVNGKGNAPSFFEKVQSSLKGIRKAAPSEALEEVGKFFRGAGAIGGIVAGFYEISNGAAQAAEALKAYREGAISAEEKSRRLAESIPVLGHAFSLAHNISDFINEISIPESDRLHGFDRFAPEINAKLKEVNNELKETFRAAFAEAEDYIVGLGRIGSAALQQKLDEEEGAEQKKLDELLKKRLDPSLDTDAYNALIRAIDAQDKKVGAMRLDNRRKMGQAELDVAKEFADKARDLEQENAAAVIAAKGDQFETAIAQVRQQTERALDALRLQGDNPNTLGNADAVDAIKRQFDLVKAAGELKEQAIRSQQAEAGQASNLTAANAARQAGIELLRVEASLGDKKKQDELERVEINERFRNQELDLLKIAQDKLLTEEQRAQVLGSVFTLEMAKGKALGNVGNKAPLSTQVNPLISSPFVSGKQQAAMERLSMDPVVKKIEQTNTILDDIKAGQAEFMKVFEHLPAPIKGLFRKAS